MMMWTLICVALWTLMVPGANGRLTKDEISIFTSYGVIVSQTATDYTFESDGLPDHEHGDFPNPNNPNEVQAQMHNFTFPRVPIVSDPPGCLPMGPIGLAINGVALFNPYTISGYNAVEGDYVEIFDDCDGHPDEPGTYHYHKIPGCLYSGERNQLLGVAFDGHAIYSPLDENGGTLTTEDLDFCHGRVVNGTYRYHMTYDFPYILGCYHGVSGVSSGSPPPGRNTSDHDGCYANYSHPQPASENPGPAPGSGHLALPSLLLTTASCLLLFALMNCIDHENKLN